MSKAIIFYFVLQVAFANSARILGVVPTPSYSHQVAFQPIWRELSLRGHQVIVLTTNPVNDPTLTNLTEIDLNFVYEFWDSQFTNLTDGAYNNPFVAIDLYFKTITHLADLELQHPKVQELINDESQHFDLIIVEYLLPIMYAFGERFNCPMIGMLTEDVPNYVLTEFGNPTHPSVNLDDMLPFVGELTFFQRLTRIIFDTAFSLFKKQYVPAMDDVIHKHFGSHFPKISELTKRISMLFSNGDYIFGPVKPLLPTIVEIGGGIHIKPLKPLPQDLEKFLDSASEGFIYFSLGSNVKSKDLSSETKQAILETFSELPYKIVWKFEDKSLPNVPENVLISKWLPQQDILRHPNIKLFIFQGGYQSIEEALYAKVPVLAIPFFGDQDYNANRIVYKGFGLRMDDGTKITKSELKTKISEIIQNLKYRNKVEELSILVTDQPMTGLEKAVWWSEYVIRHKGAKHLKTPALDLPAYQYYLIDVICFFVLLLILAIFLMYKVVKFVTKLCKHFFLNKSKLE